MPKKNIKIPDGYKLFEVRFLTDVTMYCDLRVIAKDKQAVIDLARIADDANPFREFLDDWQQDMYSVNDDAHYDGIVEPVSKTVHPFSLYLIDDEVVASSEDALTMLKRQAEAKKLINQSAPLPGQLPLPGVINEVETKK